MEKGIQMKMDSSGIPIDVEYTETCKIIRKKLTEDIRKDGKDSN